MELKFEVNEQEIVDKVLEIVKDEFIPKSVIDEIKAEIRQKQWHIDVDSANQVIEIINKHIKGDTE